MFLIIAKEEYPDVATKALKSLLPLSRSYLFEAGLFVVIATKRRYWRGLDISYTFQVSLSPTMPRWDCPVV